MKKMGKRGFMNQFQIRFVPDKMRISRIDNVLAAGVEPAVRTPTGEWWFWQGKLHRGGGLPAVKTQYSELYFFRGISITREIAQGLLSVEEILEIKNAEQRQAAMAIVGHDKFLAAGKIIDTFTPVGMEHRAPMYTLVEIISEEKKEIPVKILKMRDPNKEIYYYVRVSPKEKTCKEALAQSYGFENYKQYAENQLWENVRIS